MLILSRKVGETIVIADNIKLTVLQVKGKQVRIGIDAPENVSVHREEIYERIKGEQAAGKITPQPAEVVSINGNR